MSRLTRQRLSQSLSSIAESAWFAYLTIALLQVKVMLWIWEYRDLTPGDASEYYTRVYTWLEQAKTNIVWSPLYTLFLAALHRLLDDPFWVLTVTQISVAICASLLTLALLRRLLPKYMAWLIAAWWALLPINFDTVYNVHLFSALFPLAIFVIAAYANNIYGRGIVLGGLLLTTVLVRNEYSALFILCLVAIAGYEFYAYRKQGRSLSLKTYLFAYGLPVVTVFLITGVFYARATNKYPQFTEDLEAKHTLNVCQIYAYNREQQGDSWDGNPWTECQSLIERDFGRPAVSFSQAFFLNPRAILEHIWWNIKLIPSGTQLALFNYYGGGTNPDYMLARHSPLVWGPFLLVLGLSVVGAMTYFIIPALRKRLPIENAFAWFLMLSAALLVVGIIMMQRPRPSYMFPYSLFIMALAGLGLHRLFEFTRTSNIVKALLPFTGILLILFVPPYYDADYLNDFGYKGQTLRQVYLHNVQHINRTSFPSPSVFITPTGNYTSLCNYLGISCSTLDMESNLSPDHIKKRVLAKLDDFQKKNIYVLYLDDMIWKVGSEPTQEKGEPLSYVELLCFSFADNVMTCRDGTVDLNRGFMNDGTVDIPLRAALFVNDGYIIDQKNYRNDEGYYLQVLMMNKKIHMILVADERLFWTDFNQQFLLGNYNRQNFEEMYNNSPEVRVLKVKKAVADDSTR